MSFRWVNARSDQPLHPEATRGGVEADGSPAYIGRAQFNGNLIPCKVVPSRGAAYLSTGGKEHVVYNYELLVGGNPIWFQTRKSEIPPHAFIAGKTAHSENLYIGRVAYKKSICIGKVHPSHSCIYFAYEGKEKKEEKYEILCQTN